MFSSIDLNLKKWIKEKNRIYVSLSISLNETRKLEVLGQVLIPNIEWGLF